VWKRCDAASTGNDREDSDENMEEEQPVPTFGKAVPGFETVRQYLTSIKIDNASMQ
jgi:hypothetical protein